MIKTAKNIQKREKPIDVFYTPPELVEKHLSLIDFKPKDILYDPFKGQGAYFNNYPKGHKKYYTEITEGLDFFKFDKKVDIIVSNPPFSLFNEVFKKSIELKPRIISYLMGCINLSPKRLKMMKDAGYGLTKLVIVTVSGWFAATYIVVWELDKEDVVTFVSERYKFVKKD